MSIICPTITAENPHVYREQIERVSSFAPRLHVDVMDGIFTPNKSVELSQLWWPEEKEIDIHLMYQSPDGVLDQIIELKPSLLIVHASVVKDVQSLSESLGRAGIKLGVALFPDDQVSNITESLPLLSHVLVFSGNLGYQGGSVADLGLLSKVEEIKKINPNIEIGWDGGVNDQNAFDIAEAGVDVINSGGYIHTALNPENAYKTLATL